jgi:hypothetical protein
LERPSGNELLRPSRSFLPPSLRDADRPDPSSAGPADVDVNELFRRIVPLDDEVGAPFGLADELDILWGEPKRAPGAGPWGIPRAAAIAAAFAPIADPGPATEDFWEEAATVEAKRRGFRLRRSA